MNEKDFKSEEINETSVNDETLDEEIKDALSSQPDFKRIFNKNLEIL